MTDHSDAGNENYTDDHDGDNRNNGDDDDDKEATETENEENLDQIKVACNLLVANFRLLYTYWRLRKMENQLTLTDNCIAWVRTNCLRVKSKDV